MRFDIENLRKIDGEIEKIILSGINIKSTSKVAQFFFINDKVINANNLDKIRDYFNNLLPDGYTAQVDYEKRVLDEQILQSTVIKYMYNSFPSVRTMIDENDVAVKKDDKNFYYYISLRERLHEYFTENQLTQKLENYFKCEFCEEIKGALVKSNAVFDAKKILHKKSRAELLENLPLAKIRSFEFQITAQIEGEVTDTRAVYMSDCDFETDSLTVCGKIVKIDKRLTKKEKPYYLFEFTDNTFDDGLRTFKAKMFPPNRAVEKLDALKEGDIVALGGKMELFNYSLSMTIAKIAYALMPQDFVPEKLESREPPSQYITIAPEPYIEYSQKTLFEQKKILPNDLTNNTFVIFDLETTGLNNNPSGLDKMDTIIEIGAVKLEGGIITEQFSTLVKPDRAISEKITSITGIDDEMVKDAPELKEVLPDFFKFTRGAKLVGHNVEFDYKFIRHYSKEMGYIYDNRAYDTVSLSQELLFLRNNKLDTVAEHFGLEFNHHRALSDAVTTAKIFIELIIKRKDLPN